MKKPKRTPLPDYIESRGPGTQARLAEYFEVHPPAVHKWLYSDKDLTVIEYPCGKIELEQVKILASGVV